MPCQNLKPPISVPGIHVEQDEPLQTLLQYMVKHQQINLLSRFLQFLNQKQVKMQFQRK
jgi:hypothetical protein